MESKEQKTEGRTNPGSAPKSGPMGRIAQESRGLVDDLCEWVDLRIQLIQMDVEERIEKVANELMSMMVILVMALFTVVFLLHGVAVWIGSVLGGTHWGYLIVGTLLGFVTWAVRRSRPNHFRQMAALYRVEEPAGAEAERALPEPETEESASRMKEAETGGNERG